MNRTRVHFITLLCAVIAKAEKGFESCLCSGYSLTEYRMLAQLTLPESSRMRANELARALVVKPSVVESALSTLEASNDLCADSGNCTNSGDSTNGANDVDSVNDVSYGITPRGKQHEYMMALRFASFLENACKPLTPSDQELLHALLFKLLVKPGSFFYPSSDLPH